MLASGLSSVTSFFTATIQPSVGSPNFTGQLKSKMASEQEQKIRLSQFTPHRITMNLVSLNTALLLLLVLGISWGQEDCPVDTVDGECTSPDKKCPSKDRSTKTENNAEQQQQQLDPYLQELLRRFPTNQFYINGSWVKSHGTDDTRLMDPSTGLPFARVAMGNDEDVDLAVQAAHEALTSWSFETTPADRKVYVERLLETYAELSQEMAFLMSREMGSPINAALSSQVGSGTYHLEESLALIDEFEFVRTLPNIHVQDIEEADTTILMDPVGVVAAITPWNWPMNQITVKVIPALLVGCTVVLKPSEITPISALVFAEAMNRAGFPPGVFNLVNGRGNEVGGALSAHPLVDMVSFTGSTRAGAQVSKAAADTFKRVSLELGGKGAKIIFADVGEEWADEIFGDIDFFNSGQSCNYPSRWLVERPLYEKALAKAKLIAEATRVDSAHIQGHTHIGPVSSMIQFDRIQELIKAGIDGGARVIAGGLGRPDHLKDSPGAYVRPTIFADCTPEMRIFQEEVFGPVICFTPFDTEEEAIALANSSPYGLTNYAYSSSGPRRRRLAHALKSGMIEMNDAPGDFGAPFGGLGFSGSGMEGGIYGMQEFCHIKSVTGYHDSDYDQFVEEQ